MTTRVLSLPSRPLRAVVFDMDGTLVDSNEAAAAVYVDVLRDLGRIVTVDDVRSVWSTRTTDQVLTHFLGRPCSEPERLAYRAAVARRLSSVVPFAGIHHLLVCLAAQGVRLGIVTGATRLALSTQLAGTGLQRFFEATITADDGHPPKPSPDSLMHVCELLRTPPSRTAYVGDTDVDMEFARLAGVLPVMASWGSPDQLSATTQPALVANHPREVWRLVEGLPHHAVAEGGR